MAKRVQYDTIAKALYWIVVGLLIVQYSSVG
jgi:hypothetical protein